MSLVPLAGTIVRAGGTGRAALIVACTGLTSGLLLVAAAIARVDGDQQERLFGPVADPGTRGGAVFAVVLMTVPLLLLHDQAVRLGSSSRQRRYAALSIAGATRRDLRRWAALEVGGPAALGSVAGLSVWAVLVELLGAPRMGSVGGMVPTRTSPGWWGVLVLLAVPAYGVVVGLRSGGHAADLLQSTRGVRPPPRPWSGLLLIPALALVPVTVHASASVDSQLLLIPALALVVVGLAGLAPWSAYRTAAFLQPRAQSAELLLATRRLMADARPAGRASAAVGAVALAGAATGAFAADLRASNADSFDQEGTASIVLVVVALLIAMLTISGTLAVHSAEVLLERRREMASLVATGVPETVVSRSQRLESSIATWPMAVVGVAIGALGYGALGGVHTASGALIILGGVVVTLLAVVAANLVSLRLVRPWVRDAVGAHHLRTE